MSERQVSLGFQSDKTAEEYVELARIAERGGVDSLCVYHDLFFQPALFPLLLMARATERVRLGFAALNPYTLHPVEIAGQVAALDAVSAGRAYLGLVRGSWFEAIGVEPRRPVATLRETAEIVRRLLAGDASGFQGDVFSLAPGARLHYEPVRREVPLMLGTWRPGVAALAGEVAQELKIGGTTNPELVPVMREWIGNDAVAIVVGAVCVVGEDGRAARERVREEAALYFPVVAELDPTLEVPPGLAAEVGRLVDAGDSRAGGALIPDALLDRLAFSGTPAQVARQAEALFEAGASRVEFGTPHGLSPRRGVELLVERVVSALRG